MSEKCTVLHVYLASTSIEKKEAVYRSLQFIFKKVYDRHIILNLKEIEFGTDLKYTLLTIHDEKVITTVRSEPTSGKETVSGSKLRAYNMFQRYPHNWCVGIETGIVECYSYHNKTDVSKGTIPHEMEDNPSALEHLEKFKEEGEYQLDLNAQCNKMEHVLQINDISHTDSYNVTAVTVISPEHQSVTYLSNGVPMPFTSDKMEEYDYLYHELERDMTVDIEGQMGSSCSDRTKSMIEPLTKAFGYLLNLSTPIFIKNVQNFWTKERRDRYFKDTGKTVPDYSTFSSNTEVLLTPCEFWSLLN